MSNERDREEQNEGMEGETERAKQGGERVRAGVYRGRDNQK